MKVVNTYMPVIPSFVEGHSLLAVCTIDTRGMYAVYIGIVPVMRGRTEMADWVMANGIKQSYNKATAYFPAIPKEMYRE